VRELELERDRLHAVAGKADEEEEAEVVADLAVDADSRRGSRRGRREHARPHTVEDMRGMACDEGRTGIE